MLLLLISYKQYHSLLWKQFRLQHFERGFQIMSILPS